MKKVFKKQYKVRCCECLKVFDVEFNIEEGSENKFTDVEVFCKNCKKIVEFSIQGEPEKVSYNRLNPK
jgi:hypothetical protein